MTIISQPVDHSGHVLAAMAEAATDAALDAWVPLLDAYSARRPSPTAAQVREVEAMEDAAAGRLQSDPAFMAEAVEVARVVYSGTFNGGGPVGSGDARAIAMALYVREQMAAGR